MKNTRLYLTGCNELQPLLEVLTDLLPVADERAKRMVDAHPIELSGSSAF